MENNPPYSTPEPLHTPPEPLHTSRGPGRASLNRQTQGSTHEPPLETTDNLHSASFDSPDPGQLEGRQQTDVEVLDAGFETRLANALVRGDPLGSLRERLQEALELIPESGESPIDLENDENSFGVSTSGPVGVPSWKRPVDGNEIYRMEKRAQEICAELSKTGKLCARKTKALRVIEEIAGSVRRSDDQASPKQVSAASKWFSTFK